MTRALDKAASRWGQAGILYSGSFRGVLQATPLPETPPPHNAGCDCDRCIVDKLREDPWTV